MTPVRFKSRAVLEDFASSPAAAVTSALGAIACCIAIVALSVILSPDFTDVPVMCALGALGAGALFFAALGVNCLGRSR
jgi:hypothetical protein